MEISLTYSIVNVFVIKHFIEEKVLLALNKYLFLKAFILQRLILKFNQFDHPFMTYKIIRHIGQA